MRPEHSIHLIVKRVLACFRMKMPASTPTALQHTRPSWSGCTWLHRSQTVFEVDGGSWDHGNPVRSWHWKPPYYCMILHVPTSVANIFFGIFKLRNLTCIVGNCAPALGFGTPFKPPKFQLTNAFCKVRKGTSSGQQRSCPHGSLHSRTWTGLGTPGHRCCCCLWLVTEAKYCWIASNPWPLLTLHHFSLFSLGLSPICPCCLANGHHRTIWDHMAPDGTIWGLLVDLVLIIIEQGFGVRHSSAEHKRAFFHLQLELEHCSILKLKQHWLFTIITGFSRTA